MLAEATGVALPPARTRAAHDDDFGETVRHARLDADGERQVGQPAERHERDFARRGERALDNLEHGALFAERRSRLWKASVAQAVRAVYVRRKRRVAEPESSGRALVHRNILAPGGFENPQSVGGAALERHVAEHGGQRLDVQLRAREREQNGGGVVNAGVGVDDGRFHPVPLSLRVFSRRRAALVALDSFFAIPFQYILRGG